MIDYPNHYDKITLFCFPGYAGGNFLMNCLSLSDRAVFRDSRLAELQLQGNFNYKNKIEYLHNKLKEEKSSRTWQDLNLGCHQLFGVRNTQYLQEYPEHLKYQFNYVVQDIMDQNLNFYLISHGFQLLQAHLKFWSQARVIFFVNYRNFILQRKGPNFLMPINDLQKYWDTVKGDSWPKIPPINQSEFDALDPDIQQELRGPFKFEISRWFDRTDLLDELYMRDFEIYKNQLKDRCYVWDTSLAYSNSTEFLKQFYPLQQWLNLPITANSDIVDYFEHWKNTLQHIKSSKSTHKRN